MKRVAARKIPFVDLYTRHASLERTAKRFTFSIHLNQYGYWAVAQLFVEQLGMTSPS
jgi:hypothetical protein